MPLQLGTYLLCKFLWGGFHICLIRISYQKLVHQFRLWNDEKSLKVFFSLQIIFSHRVSRPHREFCGMPDSQDSSFFSHSFLWMGRDCHLLKWDDSNHMQYVSQNLSIMFSHFLHITRNGTCTSNLLSTSQQKIWAQNTTSQIILCRLNHTVGSVVDLDFKNEQEKNPAVQIF